MNLTEKLKQWLQKNAGVAADASDDEYRKACGEALATGKLAADEFQKLTVSQESKAAGEISGKLDTLTESIGTLVKTLTAGSTPDGEGDGEKGGGTATATETDGNGATPDASKNADGNTDGEKGGEPKKPKQVSATAKMIGEMGGTPTTIEDIDVKVKQAADQYDDTKKGLVYPMMQKSGRPHPLAGRQVMDFDEQNRPINESSDLERAVAGSFSKLLVATAQRGGSRSLGWSVLPQHDKELLMYSMENMFWGGATDGGDFADIKNRKLNPGEAKALIDDATSGGIEAAPIVFDDMVIQTPLLHGELFPLVNTVPLDRGRRVEGVSVGTVTSSWGGIDDTAITLFNTASYVSAFDTTVFRWEGAIHVGLDFLSDTPIDFGALITAQYGERLLEDLDDVIATGNGTTQPEGVMNKSGVTSVTWGAATSIGNYESMRYTVSKSEHRSTVAASAVFCGTETSYQRARAIPVGATDARRLFGMDHLGPGAGGYTFGGANFKINESLTNAQVFYAILARYRMYRRRGLTMRSSTEGDTLIRNNAMLMVAMARYGGQLERSGVASLTTDAPA